ncbi:DUF1501 domain-containing protein [Pendulispora albinea]|uniref:DUF1501 domain-containing protein n=1 Tax=Pendulispora albinea TaxID=2741071 RepID=A0ABZ2M2S2_9BACT
MNKSSRRSFLKALAGSGVAALASTPLVHALAAPGGDAKTSDEFFLLLHALGGWDVTLSLDPRWDEVGLIDPATTANTNTLGIRLWENDTKKLSDGGYSFQPIRPKDTPFVFGPAIGSLADLDLVSRLCVVNGLATNTVSHPDGQTYAVTGRHLNGGRPNQSSIDVCCANEFGTEQLLPVVSVEYPSYLLGSELSSKARPLRISKVGTMALSLSRATAFDTQAERNNVNAVLTEEAAELAEISNDPSALQSLATQYSALDRVLSDTRLQNVFSEKALVDGHKEFNFPALRHQYKAATNAAFAIEAFANNMARCVSFAFNGFDTHANNYAYQAATQQETFDILAALIRKLDTLPHPTRTGAKLSQHTHILVTSDFCRTPAINIARGRDHHPNGSALVISPKFKGKKVFGSTDVPQLLPRPIKAGTFMDGERAVAPPDLLATFVSAFGVNPQKYFREGEVIKELLAT